MRSGLWRASACGLAALLLGAACSLAEQTDEAYIVTQLYLKHTKPIGGGTNHTFTIDDDKFVLDGVPTRLISGEMHYFRIHPDYWVDRLVRAKSLGLNAVQIYVPWNLHNPYPSVYKWDGIADVERFVRLAQRLGLLVLLRPGPYICAEWDFGGLPWWLASTEVTGGFTMKYRRFDAAYLKHVDKWWGVLLGRLRPLLIQNGGPIAMVQVENEFGFIGPDRDYMQHLVRTARASLGDEVVLYTVDPPPVVAKGGPDDGSVFAAVDFGPGWFPLSDAFGRQALQNEPGKSPAFCVEFYTGWLSYDTLPIQNTTLEPIVDWLDKILKYRDGWGSVSLYMAVGGTNFGWSTGAQVDVTSPPDLKIHWDQGRRDARTWYKSVTTSYDYTSPVSEAGDYGQPGVGGPSRFDAIRATILNNTGVAAESLPVVPPPRIYGYGAVNLTQAGPLLGQLPNLHVGRGIPSEEPLAMEEYGQQGGLILYRTRVSLADAFDGSKLYFGSTVRDSAHVLVDGKLVGLLSRNGEQYTVLRGLGPPPSDGADSSGAGNATLDVLVAAHGRANTGLDYDRKGLVDPLVVLNGNPLTNWEVFPLTLTNTADLCLAPGNATQSAPPPTPAHCPASTPPRCRPPPAMRSTPQPSTDGPVFYRGTFNIDPSLNLAGSDHVPDTYLSLFGWGKGLAFINGFNLGWYWVSAGPANTMYVPGPVLKKCQNELILLELDNLSLTSPSVNFTTEPNFLGPTNNATASVEVAGYATFAGPGEPGVQQQLVAAEGRVRGGHDWPLPVDY